MDSLLKKIDQYKYIHFHNKSAHFHAWLWEVLTKLNFSIRGLRTANKIEDFLKEMFGFLVLRNIT